MANDRSIRRTGSTQTPATADDLLEWLESQIVSRHFSAGTLLPSERVLSEQFGLSRPVVREALRALQTRGLIEPQAGRGSFVRDLHPTRDGASIALLVRRGEVTARHLVSARLMVECEAARLAAIHHTDADAQMLTDIVKAFESTSDPMEAAELDIAFHEGLALASANPVLQIMFGSIRDLTWRMMVRSLTDTDVRSVGGPMHRTILDAVLERRSDDAAAMMLDHIGLANETYGDDLDRPLSEIISGTPTRPSSLGLLTER